MPHLPRRFRRPRAELRVGLSEPTPPDEHSGSVVRLVVTLVPEESFRIRDVRLEMVLSATWFSRTALDGFFEHTSEQVWQSVILWEDASAESGITQAYSMEFSVPSAPQNDSRPVRMQWHAKARLDAAGYRELSSSLLIRDVTPQKGRAPVVDGSGFLPLYEFRTNADS